MSHNYNTTMKKLKAVAALCLMILSLNSEAKQFKTISSREGLSNNAILSMHQDNKGHLYLGTMDGLNIWNGNTIEIFSSADGKNIFFGNKIRHIIPGSDEKLYLLTTYGLAVLDIQTRNVAFFENMAFSDIMTVTEDGNIFSVNNYNKLQYLDTKTSELRAFPGPVIEENEECRRMFMMKDGRLCIMTSNSTYLISFDNALSPAIRKVESLAIPCLYVAPRYDDSNYLLITADRRLCSFNIEDGTLETKAEIDSPFPGNDDVTGIIPTDSTYLIGFRESGVKILEKGQKHLLDTDIDCRVLSMIPDKKQPIIWIGTDCNGLIRWSSSTTDITCITYDDLPYSINTPVRSIYLDNDGDLWFGTKGDGLFRIRDFREKGEFDIDKFCEENSNLVHNSIYTITESCHPWIWIGSDGDGLNYYSYKSGRLGIAKGSIGLSNIHCVLEQDGETLWVSTDGQGCYRCRFTSENGVPVITEIKKLDFTEPFNHKSSVYSIAQQNDSILWFGSRRNGVLAYNINTEKSLVVQFPTTDGLAANETFYVTKAEDMLFATGNGVAAYSHEKDSVFLLDYVPKKATHAILPDRNGHIWITTNSGIISLDEDFNYRASFNRFSGMEVIEYSDGACFYDFPSNTIFFGGINGFTVIKDNVHDRVIFNPELNITNFIQNNTASHIGLKMKNGKLKIPYSQSVFGIEFSIVDNLNYPDYRFLYKIDGHNKDWAENQNNIIYFPLLAPGNYTLRIKYLNLATGYESEEECLPIYIVPPVHRRWWAIVIYILLGLFVIYRIIKQSRDRYAAMQEKLRKQYKKEILKVKNDTIDSVTEELSTQTTFMLGLCQQIRTQTANRPEVEGKVNLLEYNITKINKILHILNEYKGITAESSGEVALVHVGHIANELLEIMKPGAKARKVTIFHKIDMDIILPVNKQAFYTIFNTLTQKIISICDGRKEMHLDLYKKNNGEGICISITATVEEEIYRETMMMMENDFLLERTENDEDISNLEFVLCRKLINEMNGTMAYGYTGESKELRIHISLPQHEMEGQSLRPAISSISEDINTILPEKGNGRGHLQKIYVISINKETSSFLEYFLSDKYNVCGISDNQTAFAEIKSSIPAAVIYDITSIRGEFSEFITRIRQNKFTGQIPVLTLTSSLQITEREECIKQGADLCISFPFKMDYLMSALERMLNKRASTAEYYNSAVSAYVMNEGKILHRDEQDFINKILKFIEENLSNPNLNITMMSQTMGISERGIYRRFEDATDKTLHQIIKEARIELAAKLLTSSKLTIDEIMFKVGYENRSTFHRNFKEAKGMTPKEYRQRAQDKAFQTLSDAD